jgi:hypothetical protein
LSWLGSRDVDIADCDRSGLVDDGFFHCAIV